jgi:hypothetical protein
VRLVLRARDLLLASWDAEPERIGRVLPPGLRAARVDGRHLVTIAAFHVAGGRLGRLPVPPYSQLNVRAYVEHRDEPAVYFLMTRVTLPGMGGALLGAPYRPARVRVDASGVEAPGLGVSVACEVAGPSEPSELEGHRFGLYEAAGVRGFRISRGPADWQAAVAVGPARADPLVALGFDVSGPPSLLYTSGAGFEAELPPRRITP